MRLCLSLLLSLITLAADAQKPYIQMEQSNTTASFRGIHAAGPGVAWASGTNGTVVRTEDAGFEWQGCAMPPGAEKLDFRGIWAWDAQTAIVMSSGPGDQSRIYKTTDGCVSWKLLGTNSDKDGFWDAIAFSDRKTGYLLGDPVGQEIVLMRTEDGGVHWKRIDSPDLFIGDSKLGFFAASNSSMIVGLPLGGAADDVWLGTASAHTISTASGPLLLRSGLHCGQDAHGPEPSEAMSCITAHLTFDKKEIPLAGSSASAGVFSIDARVANRGKMNIFFAIAVGGDYQKPSHTAGTAAWSNDFGKHWTASTTPPHGYRSAVAWDPDDKAWITAGPNGTDFSRDDGRTWLPLENGNWNAIRLPYLVGPSGRIGKLVSLPAAGRSPGPAGQNAHSTKP